MKHFYLFTLVSIFCFNYIYSQTMWTGPTITVTKANFASWTSPSNQDALTANVILTRANNRGIFNIAQETEFDNINYTSPIDTEWAVGSIANGVSTLTFDTWDNTHMSNPTSVINNDLVLHLITDDIYIDIKITAWTSGNNGGGYTYERSTDQNLSVNGIDAEHDVRLYPNPSSDYVQVKGLKRSQNFSLYNVLGVEITSGNISNNDQIDIKDYPSGLYFLNFDNVNAIKFLKK